MDGILNGLANLIEQNVYVAPLLALLAGMLTSVTPCSLSSIPLIVGYVGGTGQAEPKRALRLSLTFALGTAFTFTALGVIASMAGRLIGTGPSFCGAGALGTGPLAR